MINDFASSRSPQLNNNNKNSERAQNSNWEDDETTEQNLTRPNKSLALSSKPPLSRKEHTAPRSKLKGKNPYLSENEAKTNNANNVDDESFMTESGEYYNKNEEAPSGMFALNAGLNPHEFNIYQHQVNQENAFVSNN